MSAPSRSLDKHATTRRELVRAGVAALALLPLALMAPTAAAQENVAAVIARVRASVVAVGTLMRTRSPAFAFRGTGFAVGTGSLIATNAHVLPVSLDQDRREALVVVIPGERGEAANARVCTVAAVDRDNDLALLAMEGPPLPPLGLAPNDAVSEGQDLLFTGFPLGAAMGLVPATHRAMVAALTPLVLPKTQSSQLDPKSVRRLSGDVPRVLQLDANAYPGHSGSPLYLPATGQVVGVVNSLALKEFRESATAHPSGIVFAIPGKLLQGMSFIQ